nr:hypothetical protein [Rhodoferax sp.]
MRSVILGILGLLAAGFAFEWVWQRLPASWQAIAAGSRWGSRTKAAIVLVIVAFPVATILLAKLLRSDALGWIFGLTLVLGLAILPCAAIFYIGMKLNARMRCGRGKSSATSDALTGPLNVQVERGSVHASDEAPPRRIGVQSGTTIRTMLELATADAYLPRISGGKATWVVESTSAGGGKIFVPIAVCAQQWAEPAFLALADSSVAAHFGSSALCLNFRYRCQDDPDAVLAEMIARAPQIVGPGSTQPPKLQAAAAAPEVLANFREDPKFRQPTDVGGDWRDVRGACFEHELAPTAMKYAIEKLTAQRLGRASTDIAALGLRYSGSSKAGGHPSTVMLELRAVGHEKYLYALTNERTAPKRWENQDRFTAECERRFAHWCTQLGTVPVDTEWPAAPREALEETIRETIAAEAVAARSVEDPAPIAAVQRQVLDAMRSGMGFFTANKEGGSHLFFDGQVFRRNDYGDEPNLSETYADDGAMLVCLRRFYNWDAQRDAYPHPKAELDVWNYIRGQLQHR